MNQRTVMEKEVYKVIIIKGSLQKLRKQKILTTRDRGPANILIINERYGVHDRENSEKLEKVVYNI